MSENQETLKIPLPKGWKKHVRSAVLHVISLAQCTTIHTRGWAADSSNQRVRLKAELGVSKNRYVNRDGVFHKP